MGIIDLLPVDPCSGHHAGYKGDSLRYCSTPYSFSGSGEIGEQRFRSGIVQLEERFSIGGIRIELAVCQDHWFRFRHRIPRKIIG
ncbi:hypothetical protein CHM34_04240 [Paludifilum halophilum]|uniref:Uncharacterized protein n=1 Tax=Paludifilum halophilum TaxID=1642702 RepID=A0A235B9K5_9BACL|nr:hypothetical protein CHM34_04240 [Paludifilum halophilum]